jgi:CBS domain-containing protein
MKTLGDLPLRAVPIVEPRTALDETIELMREEPLKTVVVVGDEQFMGVFDDEALQSNLIPEGVDKSELEVGPYMLPVRMTADPTTPVETALAQMKHRKVSVLPVVKHGTFYLGVLTLADVEAA